MRFFPFPLTPPAASTFAKNYDLLFLAITALTVFFTVGVLAVVCYFAIKYRAGSNADRSRPQHENLRIEIAWSLPPLLLGLIIFAWGAVTFIDMRRPPKNAIDVFVIGKQWMWHIEHSNGVREMNELHVPEGVPVKLTMISQDVIHAFYIPAFRAQYMVVPGRYTYEWFTATRPGRYYLFCAQHCGTGHSEMGGYVYVMTPPDYAAWLANGGSSPAPLTQTMAQSGEQLYTQLNCLNCHTDRDTERAPSLVGIYGKPIKMNNGEVLTADDNYIRESIVNPYSHIVSGYTNTMPEYSVAGYKLPPDQQGITGTQLTEEQLQSLVVYIKSLTPTTLPATPQSPGQAAEERGNSRATSAISGANSKFSENPR